MPKPVSFGVPAAAALALATVATLAGATRALAYPPWGVNIGWGHCRVADDVMNHDFACNTNTGSEVIVASFQPSAEVPACTSLTAVVDFSVCGTSGVPAWWTLRGTSACRPAAGSANVSPEPDGSPCADLWQSLPSVLFLDGGTPYVNGGGSAVRYEVQVVMPDGISVDVTPDQQWFAFRIVITHAKTVGTGACAGCLDAGSVSFPGLELYEGTTAFEQVSTYGIEPYSDVLTWQGGSTACITPARPTTWGTIKALYR